MNNDDNNDDDGACPSYKFTYELLTRVSLKAIKVGKCEKYEIL